jgi:hypothetical protein
MNVSLPVFLRALTTLPLLTFPFLLTLFVPSSLCTTAVALCLTPDGYQSGVRILVSPSHLSCITTSALRCVLLRWNVAQPEGQGEEPGQASLTGNIWKRTRFASPAYDLQHVV